MKKSNALYGKLFLGILALSGLFSFLPPEFVVSTLLFIAITYAGISVIKLATSHDLKTKKENKT
ncbi:hypothetical protein NP590_14265 [Methylomonas sp. SURF-2]|uniref:Uncharacterized protein n=1 Tax=Methylomonas subterranea TaxID=2952225 RepID=A0ABT1TII0_9GAMM|nr:hypothetical protein [Methylomonas sp. SURF-2]MCQ8105276.1 hypothetical protein [Methylomonas sp. SURF-2]